MTNASPDDVRLPPGTLVVPVPVDGAARDALTARLTALAALRHPHLVAVLDVAGVRAGAIDVRVARGEAADLPAILAVRGRLSPGEAATVGVHVAQALAALHAAGLVHGPLVADDVVLRGGGAPALRPRLTVPPEEWTPADDVRAAARLVDLLLGSRDHARPRDGGLADDPLADPEGALHNALAPALAADGRSRPEAGTLAALIDAACEPAEVRLPDPATLAAAALTGTRRAVVRAEGSTAARAGAGRGDAGRRGAGARGPGLRSAEARRERGPAGRRPRAGLPVPRAAVVVATVALAVGVMTAAALQLSPRSEAHAEDATGQTNVAPPRAEAGPADAAAAEEQPAETPPFGGGDAVLDRDRPAEAAGVLTQRRLDLLAGTLTDVSAVDVTGSAAHDADSALVAQLAETGTRPVAPGATVLSATVVAEDGTRARVRVEYVVEGHEQRAADGTTTRVPASPAATSTLDLLWTEQGWRVEGVA